MSKANCRFISLRRSHGTKPRTRASPEVGLSRPDNIFKNGGLAGAVWAEKSDKFAGLDLKGDVVDGASFIVPPPEEAL